MLPYMSTPAALAAVAGTQLQRWRPDDLKNMSARRELWMPPTLIDAIRKSEPGATETVEKAAVRYRELRSYLLGFITGEWRSVGAFNDRCDIKVFEPMVNGGHYACWELRATPKNPRTRLFGVFVTPQDFVAMSCWSKADIPKSGKNAQNNLAHTAKELAKLILKQSVCEFSYRPTDLDLGGSDYGYFREAD